MLDHAECDLDVWLTPFLGVMGRKTLRSWAPFYVRGLLGPSERKSLHPRGQSSQAGPITLSLVTQ